MRRILGASLVSCAFVSCGTNLGGGSDQPNKLQAIRIVNSDGTPEVGARVVSWSGSWDPVYSKGTTTPMDSGITDNNGTWSAKLPDEGQWYVIGRAQERIAVCTPGHREAVLEAAAPLRGTVKSSGGITIDSVWMGGAGSAFLFHANDTFTIATQPGSRRIWGRVHWKGGEDTLLLAEKVLQVPVNSDLNLVVDTGSVLVVSAEALPIGSSLRGLNFGVSESNPPVWTKISAFGSVPVSSSDVLVDKTGRYFRWVMSDSESSVGTSRIHTVSMPLSVRSLDWSGVRSLALNFCRGVRGTFEVRVHTEATDKLSDGQPFQFQVSEEARTQDTTVVLNLSSLVPAPGSQAERQGLAWKDVAGRVSRISFRAESPDVTLELREIRANGERWQNW